MSLSYGTVTYQVQGANLSRFISRCARDGIEFHSVHYSRGQMHPSVVVTVSVHCAKPLLKAARDGRLRVRTVKRNGFVFFMRKVKKRLVLTIGSLIACAVLFAMTHFVWFIEVKGSYNVSEERVTELLEEVGIHRFMPIDKAYINDKMTLIHAKDEGIAHASALINGVKMTVTISEAIPEGLKTAEKSVIYAKCDGVIEEVLTYSGHALVKKGDIVHKGDILITGDLSTEEKEIYVPASGKVTAKVGYTFFGTAPQRLPAKVRSGNSNESVELEIFGLKLIKSLYDDYEVEYNDTVSHPGILFPITFRAATVYELTDGYASATLEAQKKAAEDTANTAMLRSLDKSARIISKSTAFEEDDDGTITAEVSVITIENIAEDTD